MGRRISRVPALVVAGALVAAGVSGCQSNPAPKALPSKAPASTAVASPVAAAPTMPAAAKGTGPKAAKAFARYWIGTLNYASRTGDTDQLRAATDPACAACVAIANAIDQVHADGGSFTGKGWEPLRARVAQADPHEGTMVDVLVMVHPQVVTEAKGANKKRFSGGRRLKTFTMLHSSDGWRVTRLEQSA